MPDQTPHPPSASDTKHLVLVGAGGVHVQLLQALTKRQAPNLKVTMISPDPHYWHAPRLADWVMGSDNLDQLAYPLSRMLDRCGGTHQSGIVKALDVTRQQLLLNDGSLVPYDALSIEVGGDSDHKAHEASLPGSIEHGLWIQPMARFTALWPKVTELAKQKSMRITVVGDGQIAIALALGVRQALIANSLAKPFRVSLISGANLPLTYSPPKMQSRVLNLLKSRDITVLRDRCSLLSDGEATLGCGARLASDAAIVALLAPFPSWVMRSGLSRTTNGTIEVDSLGQSTSHARVFFTKYQPINLAGPVGYDLAWRLGHFLDLPPSDNIQAAPRTSESARFFLPIGTRKALGCWRNVCLSGTSVWHAMRSADDTALKRCGLLSI